MLDHMTRSGRLYALLRWLRFQFVFGEGHLNGMSKRLLKRAFDGDVQLLLAELQFLRFANTGQRRNLQSVVFLVVFGWREDRIRSMV